MTVHNLEWRALMNKYDSAMKYYEKWARWTSTVKVILWFNIENHNACMNSFITSIDVDNSKAYAIWNFGLLPIFVYTRVRW